MQQLNKTLIRQRFGRQLHGYNRHAFIQKKMAWHLADMVTASLASSEVGRLFEIGVGSAALTDALLHRLRIDRYYANDLVPQCRQMVETVTSLHGVDSAEFLDGDIEALREIPGDLDVIVSGATVQWLEDMPGFFHRMAGALKPGGVLAFSTFGHDNMQEIRALESVGLHYHTLAEMQGMAGELYEVTGMEEERHQLDFTGPEAVLRHISRTGVNGLDGRAWTKSRHRAFIDRYRRAFSSGDGVRLTYHTMYCCFRKCPASAGAEATCS